MLAPPTQTPAAQLSLPEHALPSSHGATLVKWKQPLVTSQPSLVQTLLSLQAVAASMAFPEHLPALQKSLAVHAFASSQGRMFGA